MADKGMAPGSKRTQPPIRLGAMDWMFLALESRESMMHVGVLLRFSAARQGVGATEFLRTLRDEVRRGLDVHPPWNRRLSRPDSLKDPRQAWIEDTNFDLDYHVRHSALPAPGGERELGVLVSRLHSHALDFHRPPWEMHLIEGLEDGGFAIYCKVHHALVDGYTGIKLLARSFSSDPDEQDTRLFFARRLPSREGNKIRPAVIHVLLLAAREELGSARGLLNAANNVFRRERREALALIAPMQAPHSKLNQPIGRNRRFATQSLDLSGLKALAKRHGGTLNDAVMAVCAGALRRYLCELDALPAQALTAMLPVNIRPKDDPGGGNAVGAILASLATDLDSPQARLRAIIASTRAAKAQLTGLSRAAIIQYSGMLMSPLLLSANTLGAGRVRPAFNVVISNIPGPQSPLYFRSWRLDAFYPVSIPFHGYALNITLTSYLDSLKLGFIGCRDRVPHLQRIAVFAAQAVEELEADGA